MGQFSWIIVVRVFKLKSVFYTSRVHVLSWSLIQYAMRKLEMDRLMKPLSSEMDPLLNNRWKEQRQKRRAFRGIVQAWWSVWWGTRSTREVSPETRRGNGPPSSPLTARKALRKPLSGKMNQTTWVVSFFLPFLKWSLKIECVTQKHYWPASGGAKRNTGWVRFQSPRKCGGARPSKTPAPVSLHPCILVQTPCVLGAPWTQCGKKRRPTTWEKNRALMLSFL